LVGVCFSCSVDLGYKELVARLDAGGYRYVLPRRWRVKVSRDVRRRKGVIVVHVVDGVECYVRVERGRCVSVQVVGRVKDARSLDTLLVS